MLPRIFPPFPERTEFEIFASMDPAKEVGGDFYDFFLVDENHLALVIADVSGKGVPAALFMVIAKTLIKNRAQMGDSPAKVLTDVNEQLCEGNEANLFVTVWLAILDLRTGKGMAANAGHEHPILRRKDGKYELVVYRHSLAVATMEGLRFKEHPFELNPGDSLFVYTDGVPEATNINNELYGTDRMLEVLNRDPSQDMETLLKLTKKEMDAFVGTAPQFDDVTMLGFKFFGSGAKNMYEITVDAKVDALSEVLAFIDKHVEEMGFGMKTQMQIDIAVEEIFVNIASYAYPNGDGTATISVSESTSPTAIRITFVDSGIPYNPLVKEDPDITLGAEEREIGGLGIFMVKKSMDDVNYEYTHGHNRLTLVKNL
jgi:sigma-B regulation protein RsbU (phosphoserine phosphatase)